MSDPPGPAREPDQPRPDVAHGDEFDALYAGRPPWDIGRPQPAFLQLARSGVVRGRVLDVGCGTGEHALMAASFGLEATGIDAAPTAIGLAQRKAEASNGEVRFLVWNALDLADFGQEFDTVLDSGLFHVFDDVERVGYVESLRTVVASGGRYCMLCFSERQPGAWGPRRVSQDEIRASFTDGWSVESIEAAVMDITISAGGAQAWLAVISRT